MWLVKSRRSLVLSILALTAVSAGWLGPVTAQEQPLIADVIVEGNQYISADVIVNEVKDILKIGEPYTAQKAEAARKAVADLGYFDTVAVSYEQVGENVNVTISVVERQRIEQIVFVGNTVITDAQLKETIFSKVGHIIAAEAIRRDVRRIEDYYSQEGYIAQIADVKVDELGGLTFIINEAYIEDITIEGLKKTKEWVVRRQIRTQVGELFQQKRIADDINRIFNMGLFNDVKLDLHQGKEEPAKAVIPVIQIEEKPTGMVSIAGAYSELDDFVAMISVAENNLRGRAERISLDTELGGRTSYDFKFYEPYLDSRDTALDLSVFDTQRQRRFVGGAAVSLAEDQFEERRTGATITLSRPMTDSERVSIGMRSEQVSSSFLQGTRNLGSWVGTMAIPGPEPPPPGDTNDPLIVAAPLHPGGRVNSFTLGWQRDSRDIVANPTSGSYQNVSLEMAGSLLGGESTYQRYSLDRRRYFGVRGHKDVIALRLMLGTTTGNIPLFDSFTVGGARSLRGYTQDRFRGESVALLNAEYRYSLSKSLTVVAFMDAGDAFGGVFRTEVPGFDIGASDQNLDVHVGMGFGIRAITPMGPLRLDFGFGEDGSQTHFGFGHTF